MCGGDSQSCLQCFGKARSGLRVSGSSFPSSFRGIRNRPGSGTGEVMGLSVTSLMCVFDNEGRTDTEDGRGKRKIFAPRLSGRKAV